MKRAFLFSLIILLLCCSSCSTAPQEKQHYLDLSNFSSFTAEIRDFSYDANSYTAHMAFELRPDGYYINEFVLEGRNLSIARANGLLEKVSVGDIVTVTSAACVFYNGDSMPVVALTVNGESLLDFDEGYANLIDSYD